MKLDVENIQNAFWATLAAIAAVMIDYIIAANYNIAYTPAIITFLAVTVTIGYLNQAWPWITRIVIGGIAGGTYAFIATNAPTIHPYGTWLVIGLLTYFTTRYINR